MEKNIDDNIYNLLDNVIKLERDVKLDKPANENMINLAYIGDVIYDLYISDKLIRTYNGKKKINDINKIAQKNLCAKAQARNIERLIDEGFLTDEEKDIYTHGRNASSHTKSKNSTIVDYRKATGFEALIGYIYYKRDLTRLIDILENIEIL